jgi:hypothetical protein
MADGGMLQYPNTDLFVCLSLRSSESWRTVSWSSSVQVRRGKKGGEHHIELCRLGML